MKIFKLLVALIFINVSAFGQEYIPIDQIEMSCYYKYDFQEDSTSKYSMKSQEMVLQLGKKRSLFVSSNNMFADSLLYKYRNEPPQVGFSKIWPLVQGARTHAFCDYHIYKNYPAEGSDVLTDRVGKKNLRVVENNDFEWELVAEADSVIAGFRCNKAFTRFGGRNYVAWYTLEIPISEGPYKFNGLPGLIILIQDDQREHKFELMQVSTQKAGAQITYADSNFIEIKSEDYVKAIYARIAQMFHKVQGGVEIQMNGEEPKAMALDRLKSRNNFIEKY
jgi:GLPGLI family protein